MPKTPAPLAAYPFVTWESVRFRDLDVLGHVNNAVYATYFETARIAYYQALTHTSLEQLGMILADLTISYKAPAHFGDELAIGVRIPSFGTKSFVMEYALARVQDDALLATCRTVLVAFDYRAGHSVPVPEAFKAAVAQRQQEG